MKKLSGRKNFFLILIVLMLAAFACQTISGGLNRPTPTSNLAPIPTKTFTPTSPPPTSTPLISPTPTLTPAVPTIEALPTPTIAPITKEMQLEVFQDLWEVIRDEYLYEDYNGVDWNATYDQYRQMIEDGMDTFDFYVAMDTMIYSLGDDHSAFLPPYVVVQEEQEYTTGHDYVGIGVWIQFEPDRDHAVVLLVFPGGPAEEAGIHMRDVILSVNGIPLNDEQGAALQMLLGEEGTEVTIVIQSPGGKPREITLPRRRITGAMPVPYQVLLTPQGQRIGYLLVPTFADSTIGTQMGDALFAMNEDGPLDGIIVDNRMNSGGYDNILAHALSFFTSGTVGYFSNRSGNQPLRVTRRNIGGSADLPLVVLVGKDTASFGEVFAGVLKDQGRATLIGETTDGNVEILWGYNFPDGSMAWIAHDTFIPINNPDADWEGDGIVVDIEAPAYWADYTIETDPAIVASLDFFDQ